MIGHGAFIELLVLALAKEGLQSQVSLWPQGELPADLKAWDARPVASIALSKLATGSAPDALVDQILKRRTPKSDYDIALPVSDTTLKALIDSSKAAGVTVGGTVDVAQLTAIASCAGSPHKWSC